MFHNALLLLVSIVSVRAGYSYFSNTVKSDNGQLLHQTKDVELKSTTKIGTASVRNVTGCYKNCQGNKIACQCMNIKANRHGNYNFKCEMFQLCDGPLIQSPGTLFVSRKEPTCSGYCENLTYMNLCQSCKCVNHCGEKIPYHCDCTKELEAQKDCNQVLKAGFYRSGVYKINPDGGTPFSVFCEMKGDTFGKVSAWITMHRRLSMDRERFYYRDLIEYENGFYNVSGDNFWLGLKDIVRILKNEKNTVLRVEMYDTNRNDLFFEYDGFNLNKEDSYRVTYNTFTEIKGKLEKHILYKEDQFTNCETKRKYLWWHSCSHPFIHFPIKAVYRTERIKFLLRSKGIGESEDFLATSCESLQGKKYPNGYYWITGKKKEFCDMKFPEGPGASQRSAIKSCKWAIDKYSTLGSGYYWTVLLDYTKVYCDMEVVGGGWTMIGHLLHKEASSMSRFDFDTTMQNDITALERVVTESFLLNSPGLKKLDEYINISQMRFFCVKPSQGRVFHIYTKNNVIGKAVAEYFKGANDILPRLCGSYDEIDNDNSFMSSPCTTVGTEKKWSHLGTTINNRMRYIPFQNNLKYFSLGRNSFCCGVCEEDNSGEWKIFVR